MAFLPAGRPFLIAEAGVNHNGRLALALRLVDAAAEAGADAVKFQTFKADALAAASAPRAAYQKKSGSSSQRDMLRALELSETDHRALVAHCRRRRLRFMSTPFDEASADMLDGLGMTIFKIASGEITNLPLLSRIAEKRKPIILSTGMSTLDEVRIAVKTLRCAGARDLALLHCVSSYPAPAKDANLRAMATLEKAFGLPVGYSDHTRGLEVAFAAAALGARVIEKHFTLDKTLPGPDHAMSLSPEELSALVGGLARVVSSLGDGQKNPRPCELEVRKAARRSVVFSRALPKGHRLSDADLALKRPGTGLAPAELRRLLGRRLSRAVTQDAIARRSDFA